MERPLNKIETKTIPRPKEMRTVAYAGSHIYKKKKKRRKRNLGILLFTNHCPFGGIRSDKIGTIQIISTCLLGLNFFFFCNSIDMYIYASLCEIK